MRLRAKDRRKRDTRRLAVVCGLLLGLQTPLASFAQPSGPDEAARAQSLQAFAQMAPVLTHPRCLNCHTNAEHPRQTDERRRHAFLVTRGTDDNGAPALRCLSCHQASNNASSGVPGAAHWRQPPLSMGWEDKPVGALCRALTDKSLNGGRDAEALVQHMLTDVLVQWAWMPGARRTVPPVPREAFHALVQTWARTGAACPE